uniref:Uncharacterized protein n=1 Tax=Arundo donax TaxID=35708 RepID=A0A0A9FM61_ARUDO
MSFSQNRAAWRSPPVELLVLSVFLATIITQLLTALLTFSSTWRRSMAWHSATRNVEDMSFRMSTASVVFLEEMRPSEFTSWLCCSALWTWLVTGLPRNCSSEQ